MRSWGRYRGGQRPTIGELLDLDTPRPEDERVRRGITPEEIDAAVRANRPDGCPICGERHEPLARPGPADLEDAPPFIKALFGAIDRALDEPDPAPHRYTAVLSITRDDGRAVVDITATGPYELARYVVEGALSEGADHLGE